jgi:periplasmic divalent cation tolerance protein
MHSPSDCVIALVTAPTMEVARELARKALENRVAACANLVPAIESHYWWQGNLETSAEVILIFKTSAALAGALQEMVLANHPYETPEFITVPISTGSPAYLKWILDSVNPAAANRA